MLAEYVWEPQRPAFVMRVVYLIAMNGDVRNKHPLRTLLVCDMEKPKRCIG